MPIMLLGALVILTFAHQNFLIFHELLKIIAKFLGLVKKKLAYFTSP